MHCSNQRQNSSLFDSWPSFERIPSLIPSNSCASSLPCIVAVGVRIRVCSTPGLSKKQRFAMVPIVRIGHRPSASLLSGGWYQIGWIRFRLILFDAMPRLVSLNAQDCPIMNRVRCIQPSSFRCWSRQLWLGVVQTKPFFARRCPRFVCIAEGILVLVDRSRDFSTCSRIVHGRDRIIRGLDASAASREDWESWIAPVEADRFASRRATVCLLRRGNAR